MLRTLLTGAAASAIMLIMPATAAFAGTSGGGYGQSPPGGDQTPGHSRCGPSNGRPDLLPQVKYQPTCCQHRPVTRDDSNGGRRGGDENSCTCTPGWIFILDPRGHGQWDKNGKYDPQHGKYDRTQQACGCPRTFGHDGKGCTAGNPGGPVTLPCKPPVVVTCHSHGSNRPHSI